MSRKRRLDAGCTHPLIHGQVTARHGKAVHLLAQAARGHIDDCCMFTDAEGYELYPVQSSTSRKRCLPRWVLPSNKQTSKPNLVLLPGTREADVDDKHASKKAFRRQQRVHLIEVGYTGNYGVHDRVAHKLNQHRELQAGAQLGRGARACLCGKPHRNTATKQYGCPSSPAGGRRRQPTRRCAYAQREHLLLTVAVLAKTKRNPRSCRPAGVGSLCRTASPCGICMGHNKTCTKRVRHLGHVPRETSTTDTHAQPKILGQHTQSNMATTDAAGTILAHGSQLSSMA